MVFRGDGWVVLASVLRSCGLNTRLVQNTEASTLREMKESLLIIKTTDNGIEMKQFKSFRFKVQRIQEGDCKYETKSSLGLNFW